LLERILINLVANALRYTRSGAVLVGCRRQDDRVRVEVWDTGVGIAPEHQEAVFQEFYQLDNPERDRTKGLGLGLSIAARLARVLGGRIDVRSIPGRGSVFAVDVPRANEMREIAVVAPRVDVGEGLRGARVLIVDDDALVREGLAGLMEQWGCLVLAAGTGEQALAATDQLPERLDAVLCDYRLPGDETGSEVIRKLRERVGAELPAALITGDTASERLREARQSGVPLLHKPVQPARLRALLEHLITQRAVRASTVSPATPVRTSGQAG
jgi:CheY-like chemotaxis protein